MKKQHLLAWAQRKLTEAQESLTCNLNMQRKAYKPGLAEAEHVIHAEVRKWQRMVARYQ